MKILALGHKSRTGKDTAAGFLATQLRMRKQGINVQAVSFATLLKKMTYEAFKWAGAKPGDFYETHPEERTKILEPLGMDIVQLWVAVGESMNKINEKVWVNSLFENYKADILIIRDLRRIPEFRAIKERGGICIRVVKPDAPIRDTVSDNYLNDCSEWDETLVNDGSLNLLYDNVGKWIDKYELI